MGADFGQATGLERITQGRDPIFGIRQFPGADKDPLMRKTSKVFSLEKKARAERAGTRGTQRPVFLK